jgi:hypothetical protein
MEKTEMAVAGLLKRGLKSLRVDLASLLSSSDQNLAGQRQFESNSR